MAVAGRSQGEGGASAGAAGRAWPPLGLGDLASLLTLLAVGAGWIAWIRRFSAPMEADETNLISMSLCARGALSAGDFGALVACPPGHPYPPLVPTVSGAALLLTEAVGMHEIIYTTLIWCVLFAGVAWAALRRAAGPWGGLVGASAAITLSTTPSIWAHLYTELPMAALGLAALALWASSAGLSRPGRAAALGVALGLGLLSKWTFAFFLGPPVALLVLVTLFRAPSRPWIGVLCAGFGAAAALGYSLAVAGRGPALIYAWPAPAALCALCLGLDALLTGRSGRGRRPPRLGAALGVGALALATAAVAAPWYIRRSVQVLEFLALNLQPGNYDGERIPLAESWPFYPVVFAQLFGGFGLALLGIGLLRAILGRDRLALGGLVAFLCGVGFLMAAPYRAERYMLAGIGLLVPLFGAALRWRGAVPAPIGLAFAAATLVGQLSWAAPPEVQRWLLERQGAAGGPIFGGTREGLRAAVDDLRAHGPRPFRLLRAPGDSVAPLRAGLDAFARHAPPGARWIACVDNLNEQRNLGIVPGELELRGAHASSRLRESWEGQRAESLRRLREPGVAASGMLLMRATGVADQVPRAEQARAEYAAAGLAWVETVEAIDRQGASISVELWMGQSGEGAAAGRP